VAEEIKNDVDFSQRKENNNEESPIIVAQRFLNIFRQLHIFNDERRAAFDKMLLEQPPEIRSMFRQMPGGTPLQEYVDELEQNNAGKEPAFDTTSTSANNILQTAKDEVQEQNYTGDGNNTAHAQMGNIINSDNFAKILANSLAQSNAQIIKELQNAKTYTPPAASVSTTSSDGSPLKLVADESFTKIISEALAEALENSEKKRHEDNKLITQSFMDLQDNLTKLIEQNNQLKIISNSASPGDAAAAFQVKNIVDDLVKAQSQFLKETTKSQKEELSEIISVAIKESQKLSTQALVDSFKKIEETKPTPITYAASSPKNQPSIESVEQALKAQGKEFSTIISDALKESQKNSEQTIIKTIEGLHKDINHSKPAPVSNLNVEDIMKMQGELFREITKTQSQEFSNLISVALKESQRQSTETIISALGQAKYIQAAVSNNTQYYQDIQISTQEAPQKVYDGDEFQEQNFSEDNDKEINTSLEDFKNEIETSSESAKKKKKKKKKKKINDNEASQDISSENDELSFPKDDVEVVTEKIHQEEFVPITPKKIPVPTNINAISEVKDTDAKDWGWGYGNGEGETPELNKIAILEPDTEATNVWKDGDSNDDFDDEDINLSKDKDIPENYVTSAEEGEDWEWEYEEVPEGEEGEDQEWKYEEVLEENTAGFENNDFKNDFSVNFTNTDIPLESDLNMPITFILLGLDDSNFIDPYIESSETVV
jgi:hypothetical protein